MNWIETNLKAFIEVESGAAFKSEEFVENGIPVVKIANISNYTLVPTKGDSFIKETDLEKYQNVVLSTGNVLIAMSGNTTCKMGRVPASFSPSLVNQRVGWIKPVSDEIDINFVYHLLISDTYQKRLWNFATATGQPNLSPRDIKRISFVKPPKPEQTAIATLLSKVDEAIAATQNSIKAAEKLKKALMQNLLTGKLKPDGSWRTEDEFYEDEKFGKVPLGWEVKKLKDIAICLDSKRKPIKAEDRKMIQGIYPYYGAAGIIDYINNFIFDGKYLLFGEDGENLISRKVPQAFIVEGKFWVNNHAHILKEIENVSDLDFLCYLLESKNYENIVYGSAQPKINKSDLYKIKVLIPLDLNEQGQIAKKLTNSEGIIAQKQTKIQTLERLKKSLMQNLLTGKVRLPQAFIAQFENEVAEPSPIETEN